MNKIIRSAALLAAMAVASVAHASTTYDFSYKFASGDVASGSFTGDASGNLVTNLSNITVSFDGVAFSGALYGSSWNSGWVSGGAVASFDGTQNNFLFIDADYPNSASYNNYFLSVQALNETYEFSDRTWISTYDYPTVAASWSLTAVPETGNGALLVAGLGLMGLMLRRKNAQK